MPDIDTLGTFKLGDRTVRRLGYGAMQLAGPGVFGPPKDRAAAIAVLREAVARGVNHIDTSDFYGPHVVNEIIREALAPYPDDLTLVTKIGCFRGDDKSWNPAFSRADLTRAVHDNLRNLGLEALDVVNLRLMFDVHGPAEGPIEEPLGRAGRPSARGPGPPHRPEQRAALPGRDRANHGRQIVCVQNQYNLAHREDDSMLDDLAAAGIAYVPFFPLGGFSPLQSSELTAVAASLGVTPLQVALAWLAHRANNILLIPGTSSVAHLQENLAAAELVLPAEAIARLDSIGAAA